MGLIALTVLIGLTLFVPWWIAVTIVSPAQREAKDWHQGYFINSSLVNQFYMHNILLTP